MSSESFNIISHISGLTGFVFDKDVLVRVARKVGLLDIESASELTQEDEDRCEILLLETALRSPYITASSTNQHGSWTKTVGSQTMTEAVKKEIRNRLSFLYKKYEMEEELESLEGSAGFVQWIDEGMC